MQKRSAEFRRKEWREDYSVNFITEMMMPILDGSASSDEIAEIRSNLINMGTAEPLPQVMLDQVDIREEVIKGYAGDIESDMVVIGPKGYQDRDEKLPAIFFIHAGGLCVGSYTVEMKSYLSAVIKNNAVVVSVDFPLLPEHQYPETMGSLEAGIDWLIDHADELNVDLSRVMCRGLSSGAHLTAALSHRLKVRNAKNKDSESFQFCAQLLVYPILDDRPMYKCSDIEITGWTPKHGMYSAKAWLGDLYGSSEVPEDAYPLRAKDYKGLPPTFIHCAENDHDRNSCIQYATNLLDAGIFTELNVWGGAVHAQGPSKLSPTDIRIMDTVKIQQAEALTGELVRSL